MALALEIDAMFDGDMDDAAVYTDALSVATTVRAIVAPLDYGISESNDHVSSVSAANIFVPAGDLTGVTITLEVDTITVGAAVYTVMSQPTNLGGVFCFAVERQEAGTISLRGRDR